jgi:hypothetical protein
LPPVYSLGRRSRIAQGLVTFDDWALPMMAAWILVVVSFLCADQAGFENVRRLQVVWYENRVECFDAVDEIKRDNANLIYADCLSAKELKNLSGGI